MSLPPISSLAYYTPPQSLKLPPITNSPGPSSSPIRNSRASHSPFSSWSSPSPSTHSRRYSQQTCTLPSFRSSFAKLDDDILPVHLPAPKPLPEVFLSDSEEESFDRPRALIYDEEVDKFTPRRGARSTFFDISSERGQWPRTPPQPHQQTRLLKRVSAPTDTLPTLSSALPPRNYSEPAPSDNGFYPPSSPNLNSPATTSMEIETEFLPPSSPPPQTSPVLSHMTPSSPPLSPVSASSASTLLRTVSPLSLPPSSPKIKTDSDWEADTTYEVTHTLTSFEKTPIEEDAASTLESTEVSEDTTIHCDRPADENIQEPTTIQSSTLFAEPIEVKPVIEEILLVIESESSTESVQAPYESEISLAVQQVVDTDVSADTQPAPSIKLDVPELAAIPSPSRAPTPLKDRSSSPAPLDDHTRAPKRKEEEDVHLTEDDQPRKKKARSTQPTAKQRKRKPPVQKRKVTPDDVDDDGEMEKPIPKKMVRRRRRSSVTSIASCSSLSSMDEDEEEVTPCPKAKKAPKPSSNPELFGLVIECFATSRASSLAPSAIYRTLVASRPQLKEERAKKDWLKLIQDILEEGWDGNRGVFGRIDSSGKDKADRPLEARWFYSPENDDDQDRAALVKSMMPRPAKRSVTKNYKQYYYQPLGKMSRWDPEDAL